MQPACKLTDISCSKHRSDVVADRTRGDLRYFSIFAYTPPVSVLQRRVWWFHPVYSAPAAREANLGDSQLSTGACACVCMLHMVEQHVAISCYCFCCCCCYRCYVFVIPRTSDIIAIIIFICTNLLLWNEIAVQGIRALSLTGLACIYWSVTLWRYLLENIGYKSTFI